MFTCRDLFLCTHDNNFIYKGPNFLTAHGADYNKSLEKIQKIVINND